MTAKTQSKSRNVGTTAPLMEIFSSIQGEGSYLGEPQLFVRFARCPLRCLYCDTAESWKVRSQYAVYDGKKVLHRANPATMEAILSDCDRLEKKYARLLNVSLTGGEPLLYPEFIAKLAPALRRAGRRVHLETAGVQPGALAKVLDQVDHISMDWKLSSTLEFGEFQKVQSDFLRVALRSKKRDLVVKIVVTASVQSSEFDEAVRRIVDVDPSVPVIIQPVTPARKVKRRVSAAQIAEFVRLGMKRLETLRVLPQLHPVMGLK